MPRDVHNSLTTFRFTGAFSGSFQTGERYWDWDTGYLYNQNEGKQISTGNLNTAAVGQGRRSVVPQRARASSSAVPLPTRSRWASVRARARRGTRWFRTACTGQGGLADPDVQAFLYLPGQAISETETKSYFANITGTLFTLPAGDVGVAVGYEHRRENGFVLAGRARPDRYLHRPGRRPDRWWLLAGRGLRRAAASRCWPTCRSPRS